MRGATSNTLQPHHILRLPRKMTTQDQTENSWKQVKRHFQCATDPSMIRDRSDHDPTMIRPRQRKTEPAAPPRLLFAPARSRFYWKLQRIPLRLSFQISPNATPAMRGATGNTLQPHQILPLPRIMNVMIEPHHRWNVIYNARSNRQHPPTSPNTAPATQNDHPRSDRK